MVLAWGKDTESNTEREENIPISVAWDCKTTRP